VIQPIKSYSVQFVADGTSEAMVIDLSLQPVLEDFKGSLPTAVLNVVATSVFTGPLTVTPGLLGQQLNLTFAEALPEFDGSSNRVIYTVTFQLVFPSIPPA
jgi:hypothetical protein